MKEKNYKNLSQMDGGFGFSLLMIFYILISFFVQAILLLFLSPESTLFLVINSILSPLTILLILGYQSVIKKHSIKMLSLNKFEKKMFILIPLLCFGMFFGLGFLNILFSNFVESLGGNVSTPKIPLNNIWEFIIFTICLAILPAIFEEIFFRGFLLNSLSNEKLIWKILTISLCFSLYHGSISQLIYQFLYGFAFCILAIICRSTIPCIIAHFANNFLVLCCEYFKININLFNPIIILIGLIMLGIFIALSIFFIKKSGKNVCNNSKGQKEFYLPFGLFAIIICLLLIISGIFLI